MKKFLSLITLIVLTFTVCASSVMFAFAQEVSEDECDACFGETMRSLLDYEGYDSTMVQAEKQMVYDIYTNPLGYVYDFTAGGEEGFAVVIYDENIGGYSATEVYLQGENPYRDCVGTEIYVTTMTYWELSDEVYTDILSGEQLPDQVIEEYEDIAFTNTYEGGVNYTNETVTIHYVSKVDTYDALLTYNPSFLGTENLVNGCAAVAGGNLITYFDRYYEELIPNHTAGFTYYTVYIYYGQDEYVNAAMASLYSYMDITSEHGATVDTFKSGMKTYCNNKGRNISFLSCMSGSSFNYNTAVQRMQSGYPIALFLSTYNFTSIVSGSDANSSDGYAYYKYTSNHVMVGYGNREITYTYSNGTTQKYQFIYVATGLSTLSSAYFNINYHNNVNDCYAINIY